MTEKPKEQFKIFDERVKELKSCPFCGKTGMLNIYPMDDEGYEIFPDCLDGDEGLIWYMQYVGISCERCKIRMSEPLECDVPDTIDDIITKWNRRAKK